MKPRYKTLKNDYDIACCNLADARNKIADLDRKLNMIMVERDRLHVENTKLYQLNKDRKQAIVQLAEVITHVI